VLAVALILIHETTSSKMRDTTHDIPASTENKATKARKKKKTYFIPAP
jgi:hypothetical protein